MKFSFTDFFSKCDQIRSSGNFIIDFRKKAEILNTFLWNNVLL